MVASSSHGVLHTVSRFLGLYLLQLLRKAHLLLITPFAPINTTGERGGFWASADT